MSSPDVPQLCPDLALFWKMVCPSDEGNKRDYYCLGGVARLGEVTANAKGTSGFWKMKVLDVADAQRRYSEFHV